ncbi:decapping nuclease Rai1p [Monosporozyma unispora]|nr:decapping endonuclease targeting mRNA [Kazachstania unispora]
MAVSASLFINQKGTTTALKQPKEVGFYSRNQHGEIFPFDDGKLKYYYLPNNDINKAIDLNSGFKKFKNCQRDFKDVATLEPILETIIGYETSKNKSLKADIIAHGETVAKLICASFENPNVNPIDMRLASYKGQLYIKDMTLQKKVKNQIDVKGYIPYKFETVSTLTQPIAYVERDTIDKRNRKISNDGDKFCSLIRTGVGNAKILIEGDISCIYDFKQEGKDNLKHYTKLGVSPLVSNLNDSHKFENVVFKDWLRCFLTGVPRIIYGFYDDKHILKTVEEYTTEEIPILFKEHNPELASKCTNAIKWYGLMAEWLLKIVPHENESDVIKPFKLVLEDNHLKLIEIESADPEHEGLVNGEDMLSNKYKIWKTKSK